METLPRSIENHPDFQAIFGLAEDSSRYLHMHYSRRCRIIMLYRACVFVCVCVCVCVFFFFIVSTLCVPAPFQVVKKHLLSCRLFGDGGFAAGVSVLCTLAGLLERSSLYL